MMKRILMILLLLAAPVFGEFIVVEDIQIDLEDSAAVSDDIDVSEIYRVKVQAVLESGAWGTGEVDVYTSQDGDTWVSSQTISADGIASEVDCQAIRYIRLGVSAVAGSHGFVIFHLLGDDSVSGPTGATGPEGPAPAGVDNQIIRMDGVDAAQNSDVTIDDSANIVTGGDIQAVEAVFSTAILDAITVDTTAQSLILKRDATGTGAGVTLFQDAATGDRPTLRIYGFGDSGGTGSKYADYYIDTWGRASVGGSVSQVYYSIPVAASYLKFPSSGRYYFTMNATGTYDYAVMNLTYYGAGNDSSTLVICDDTGDNFDWGHGDTSNPTVYIQSANETVAEYISFHHDQTDANIGVGDGDLNIVMTDGQLVTPGVTRSVATVTTTPYSAGYDDHIIFADATSGAITINLPAVATSTGREFSVVKTDASNNVILDGNASEAIGAGTTYTMNSQYDSVTIICDGSQWYVVD